MTTLFHLLSVFKKIITWKNQDCKFSKCSIKVVFHFRNQKISKNSPVCVLICLFSKLGLSKAFPQTSHGRRFRSLLVGLDFGVDFGMMAVSGMSPVLLAPDDCNDSPDIDLCSSSDGGEMGKRTRDNSDNDRSSGESIIMQKREAWKPRLIHNPINQNDSLFPLHLPTTSTSSPE